VIGSSLSALIYATTNDLPAFFSVAERPFRFDYLDPKVDLSVLNLQNESRSLKTFGEDRVVGLPKEVLWERLMFTLAIRGNAPLANLCVSMRYNGEALICSDEYAKIAEIKFEQAYYFGDKNCYKLLDQPTVDKGKYICYDWISFNRGGKHEIDFIETDDDFVKHIWFYPSDRIDGNSPVKDACVVSYLTEEELFDFDFSETMARFKMIHEMEKRGMKGVFNGYGPNGNPKYYRFRTTHFARRSERTTTPLKGGQKNVKIPQPKEQDLLKDLSSACVDSGGFLREP